MKNTRKADAANVKHETIPESADHEEKYYPNTITGLQEYLLDNYQFRWNEVTKELEFKVHDATAKFKPLDDEREMPKLRIKIGKKGFKGFTKYLEDLLKTDDVSSPFNPFNTYFESLPDWKEGDPDYIEELCSFIEIKDQSWFNLMFRKHLVRVAACALRELQFNKHCLVFQGKQNDGKTYFIRFLSPPDLKDYYKENPPLDHKDSVIAIGQNMIINLDELHGLNQSDANKVKSLFSQTDTKVRLQYGKKDIIQPRYASFFGTINETDFLTDVTGNVRWLIFEIETIRWEGKDGYVANVDINKVWSQAYALLKNGFKHQLTKDEIDRVEFHNKSYQKTTPEMDLIRELFTPAAATSETSYFLNATAILRCLAHHAGPTFKLNSTYVGRALTFLGFKREQRFNKEKKYQEWGYEIYCENEKIIKFIEEQLLCLLSAPLPF